ncbi:MAG: glycosyl transferase family 1 [Frankiales bacterium]|nr:glycosyl transferase family 1 [Frankiales bacterium]
MKLLLDLQCVQSSSSRRGIGRYVLCLSRALAQTAGDHQLAVLLNAGDDPDRLLRARTALEGFLPARDIHVFEAAWPFGPSRTPERREAAQSARTAAIRSLRPDAVLVGSVFEGDVENVSSVDGNPAGPPTAALLFDLIPAADPSTYLLGPGADDYWRRFEDLRRCDLLLSISDYSAQQARELMDGTCPPTATVWGGPYPSGAFPSFEERPTAVDAAPVPDRYLLAVGGDHPRKNLDRLVEAWGGVPPPLRRRTPLVVACRLNVGTVRRLRRLARKGGVTPDELVLTGEVSEHQLAELYGGALAFVFPSTQEGLGMPPLEAMARDCPTVLARGSSLVELSEDDAVFFDPEDVADITAALRRLLEDDNHLAHLRSAARAGARQFTWERSARLAWTALDDLVARTPRTPGAPPALLVVDAANTAAVHNLPRRPGAVRVNDPRDVSAERLAPATAFVVSAPAGARPLVEARLLYQPVVTDIGLERVALHDPLAEQAPLLAGLDLNPALLHDVVAAAARTARWTLERPAPVVLLLRRPGTRAHAVLGDALVVEGGPDDVHLARLVDHVVVEQALLPALGESLRRARCLGTGVHVLTDASCAADVPSWASVLPPSENGVSLADGMFDRRTGWPWRRGG